MLGPLFYIVYGNDLSTVLNKCNVALYAEDTVLYTANASFADSVSKMQTDINSLSEWCEQNGVSVNANKTKIMTFGSPKALRELPPFEIKYNDLPLQIVSSYKYLGLTLDSSLNYNSHVNNYKIISSVSSNLKQFRRMQSFLNIDAAVLVYKCMLLSILGYGDIFLSAASQVNRKKLQTLQNNGLRCAIGVGVETSSNEMHKKVGLLKLNFRRDAHLMNFVFDWSWDQDYLKAPPKMSVATRSQCERSLRIKRPRTD